MTVIGAVKRGFLVSSFSRDILKVEEGLSKHKTRSEEEILHS